MKKLFFISIVSILLFSCVSTQDKLNAVEDEYPPEKGFVVTLIPNKSSTFLVFDKNSGDMRYVECNGFHSKITADEFLVKTHLCKE